MNDESKGRQKVVIIQGILVEYRIPVFEELAKIVDLTVVHSGPIVRATTFGQISTPAWRLLGFFLQFGLRRKISALRPDVVIAMFDLHWPSFASLLVFSHRYRLVLWGHRYGQRRLANRLRDALMKLADAILLYGEEDAETLIKHGHPPDKLFFAYNTIQVKNSQDCSDMPKDRFLFVGRLQKRKKLEVLLRAFCEARSQFTDEVRLEIIGDGDQYEHLVGLSKTLGIGQSVDFLGAVHEEDNLKKSFSRSFAYVSPGAVGLSVLHSFSYGVPVVTFRNEYHGPEFHNLQHNKNSLVLECSQELVDAMIVLQARTEARREMGRNAFEYYHKERTSKAMISGFLDAIGQ